MRQTERRRASEGRRQGVDRVEEGNEREAACMRERAIERTREWQREGWRGSHRKREKNNKRAKESEGKAKIEH